MPMRSSKRGYCLTAKGLQKIEAARLGSFDKLSWERISFRSCLDRTTVSRVLNGNSVDLRTLKKLFVALSLNLTDEDYCRKTPKLAPLCLTLKDLLLLTASDLENAVTDDDLKNRKPQLLKRAKQLRERAALLAD